VALYDYGGGSIGRIYCFWPGMGQAPQQMKAFEGDAAQSSRSCITGIFIRQIAYYQEILGNIPSIPCAF